MFNSSNGEEIYKVPPHPRPILSTFPLQPSFGSLDEAIPPDLIKNTVNGFSHSVSILDGSPVGAAPKPAPRHSFQRKTSVDSDEQCVRDAFGDHSPSGLSSSSFPECDLSMSSFQVSNLTQVSEVVDTMLTSESAEHPNNTMSYKHQSLVLYPSDAISEDVSYDDLSGTEVERTVVKLSEIPNTVLRERPVPKPRQRKSLLLCQKLDSSSPSDSTMGTVLSPVIQSRPTEQMIMMVNQYSSEFSLGGGGKDEDKHFSLDCFQQPCFEGLQDDGDIKECEFPSAQNNDGTELSENDHNFSDRSSDECNDYINPDIIKSLQHSVHPNKSKGTGPELPKLHFTTSKHSYLQMQNNIQQTHTSMGPPAHPQSAAHGSKLTIDFGSELLSESSLDDTTDSSYVNKEFEASPSLILTTPKPFNDIQPFRPKVPLFSTSPGAVREQETGPPQIRHCPENDLLLNRKSQIQIPSSYDIIEQITEPSLGGADSDFVVNWESAFPDNDSFNSPEELIRFSVPCNSEVNSIIETEKSTHKNLVSTEPTSVPPIQHNLCINFQSPPVPCRPANDTSIELTPLALHASPSATITCQQQQPSASSDIFKDLPTQSFTQNQSTDPFQSSDFNLPSPTFTQNQNTDPFQGSNFDLECHTYNRSKVAGQPPSPNLQSPVASPATATRNTASVQVISNKNNNITPEHICHFVIPAPSSHEYNQNITNNNTTKDPSSSDSDGTDIVAPDGATQAWDNNNSPRARLKVFDSSLLPKKNARYGYLYKQGGYKANKGWKKRWVVFNGTNLSYYGNCSAQISKRIIPVRCMVDVETDVKPSDRNSFRFKVVTTLKNRVFVFSSETLDDCLTWANTLMAAITSLKISSNSSEMTSEKPNREGFIKFGNMKKYYVTITGKTLSYYRLFEDYQMGSPTHEIDMKLASVKVKDTRKLQLWIHYGHFDLTFENDQDMQHWRMAMEDAIAEGLADDTVLKKVYENMSNQHCADCGEENPHWASINLGIVVCKNCAGIHRMFDYRLSKIRSLRMDTRVWTPSLIEVMVTIGNANANAFWEFELPAGAKILPTDSTEKRKEFIIKKYKNKKFCNLHPLTNQGPVLGEALLNAASNDNVLEMMKILFSGADVLYRREEYSPTAYDVAKEYGQRLIMELLYQNGGDPQTFEQAVTDENRLREDVRLQGFLNKAGPVGRTFEKRWCILEHGCLTYYLNERSKTFKGSIDRKDMHMIQAVENERVGYSFELSTGLKDNRIFCFSADKRDDSGEWIRTISKLMSPVAVMDHVGMLDVKLAGYVYMKESLGDDWHQTFLVFSWRGINYMNRDLKFGNLDLRKASNIKMQDSSNGYMQRGPCFVISSTGKSVYLQATLTRDTEKMFAAFQEAAMSSGSTLTDQALTNESVPVIVEKCITHIYMNGLEEKGIYRIAGQNSRVQSLLDEFRKDAWSASFNEYTVQDVSNVLKRFLRELDDSVFERINYGSWISMAGCKEVNHRLMWYKYYLEKMPQVNFQTLKRIILHLLQVSQHEQMNFMSVTNLASCFAPSLMRTAKDEQPNLISDASSKEISIMVDLMNNADYFFNVNENERVILNNIRQAEIEIQKRIQENGKTMANPTSTGILIPVHLLNREGQSVNILVTEDKTARDAMDYLKRSNAAPDLGIYVLHEQLFKGAMVRPLFPEDIIAASTTQWMSWEGWVMEDNNVCLCVQGLDLLEKLNTHFNPNHVLLGKHHYCDSKPKSRFKRRTIGFRHCKLAIYNDSQGSSEAASWQVEDLTIYLGSMHRKPLPPFKYCLTFTVKDEKYTKPPFGHCISFDTDDELFRWTAALYAGQHPTGLLSWASQ